jgi:ribosomal-protein-alanine N-acetyltransferase
MVGVALRFAFEGLGLTSVIAVTLPHNLPSRAVMEANGMTYRGEVVHAGLPHVLYARDIEA